MTVMVFGKLDGAKSPIFAAPSSTETFTTLLGTPVSVNVTDVPETVVLTEGPEDGGVVVVVGGVVVGGVVTGGGGGGSGADTVAVVAALNTFVPPPPGGVVQPSTRYE